MLLLLNCQLAIISLDTVLLIYVLLPLDSRGGESQAQNSLTILLTAYLGGFAYIRVVFVSPSFRRDPNR